MGNYGSNAQKPSYAFRELNEFGLGLSIILEVYDLESLSEDELEEKIKAVIRKAPHLKKLSCFFGSNSNMTLSNVWKLQKLFQMVNQDLVQFDLRIGNHSNLNSEGMKFFFIPLEKLTELKTLKIHVGSNKVTDEGFSMLGKNFTALNNLTELALSIDNNPGFSSESMKNIGAAFKNLNSLLKLSLNIKNSIGNEGIKALELGFKSLTELKDLVLNIEYSPIKKIEIKALIAFSQNDKNNSNSIVNMIGVLILLRSISVLHRVQHVSLSLRSLVQTTFLNESEIGMERKLQADLVSFKNLQSLKALEIYFEASKVHANVVKLLPVLPTFLLTVAALPCLSKLMINYYSDLSLMDCSSQVQNIVFKGRKRAVTITKALHGRIKDKALGSLILSSLFST